MAYSPLERVTNLLTLLLETRVPKTLKQIANELEGMYPDKPVALRGAFERDKALLREIGVPIETEVLGGDQAGETAYRIDRDRYELRGLQLDDDERHALQMAVATIRSDTGQDGVWKLGGSVLPSSTVVANVAQHEALPALRTASGERRTVEFRYRGVERTLDPYGLLLREGFWYVIGHDHGHAEVRTYRVDRIEGEVHISPDAVFERPAGFDVRAAFPADAKLLGDADDGATEADVAVEPPLAAVVRAELGADAERERRDDGTIVFRVPCTNRDAFRSWVLGLGRHAEVLGPPTVRADLVGWLRSIATASAGAS
ncbi:MAG: WYL domain-containing protein [Acidimicrobiales bacterium]